MASRHDAARALVRRLQGSHQLRGATIRYASGHDKDRADVTAAECRNGWIRLSPSGGEWARERARGYLTPVHVRVETATAGTDDAPHFGLWEALFAVLCDWEDAADPWSQSATGITAIDVVSPAEGQDPDVEDPPSGVVYSGRGLLTIHLTTVWS